MKEYKLKMRNLHVLLTDTGLVVELELLKTKTRLIDEKFASVKAPEVVKKRSVSRRACNR
jgi:hypothetical protein